MLRAGLIGVGGMGRGHLENLVRMTREGEVLQLVSICDIRPGQFANVENTFNIKGIGESKFDFSGFNCYTSADEMIAKEKLDLVVIAIPTYLHCEMACKCLDAGINVMCEKPMSLTVAQCDKMIETAKKNGKRLMIGQVLRFWGEYEALKQVVSSGELGAPVCAYFYRGGDTPSGSWENWYMDRNKSGGALQDQHIHDVDMINYLFGMPDAVSARGRIRYEGSGYDAVSTNYLYNNIDVAVNAQDDWTLNGCGFWMEFRISFEHGTACMGSNGLHINKDSHEIKVDFDSDNAYYKEVKYFAKTILNNTENTVNPPEASRDTIAIVEAENASCDAKGFVIAVRK